MTLRNGNAPVREHRGEVGTAGLARALQSKNITAPVLSMLSALEATTGRAPSRSGPGWRSRCPACGGKSEKVSIAEGNDGRVLVHAFCGCDAGDVVRAVGLTLADLYPARIRDDSTEGRAAARVAMRQTGWAAALGVLGLEAKVVAIAGHQLAAGHALDDVDQQRLVAAVERIDSAREVLR